MNDIGKLIITIVGIFSLIGSITFYLGLMNGIVRFYQGDYNTTEDIVDSATDELVSTIEWEVYRTLAIAILSALGLSSLVAIAKKL